MNPILTPALVSLLTLFTACDKPVAEPVPPPPAPPTDTAVVIQPAVDPPLASTIGFFMDDWAPRTFTPPFYKDTIVNTVAVHTLTVDASAILTKIPRAIAGHNANLWMSQLVTEPPFMTHIGHLRPHVIRFPGGSISDVFFWNAPKGVPPADAPAQLTNADGSKTNLPYWYGKNNDSWTLSVENYYRLLQQTGNTGMITINYGYARYGTAADPVAAAAHLAANWVRYDNGRTRYWEIGNENFGDWEAGYRIDRTLNKDGQPEYATGELYGQHFRVFADSMRQAARETGKTIFISAVLYDKPAEGWNTNTVKTWNSGVFSKAGNTPDFYSVHSYYTPYNEQTTAANILASGPAETKRLMDYVQQSVQGAGLSAKPVALTEWNIFATGQKQQVSFVNGMHSVLVVGEALKNKYGMTARWDLGNGWDNGNDHGLFNLGDEPDNVTKWNPRPAFYYLHYFQKFLGDRLVSTANLSAIGIETYASTFSSGEAGVTIVNRSTATQNLEVKINNFRVGARYYWYTLVGGTDNGEFSRKVYVNGRGPAGASGGPADYATLPAYRASAQNGIKISVSPKSVVALVVEKK